MRRVVLLVLSVVAGTAGACGSDAIQAPDAYDGGNGRPDAGISSPGADADAGASADAGTEGGDGAPGLGATVGPNGVTFQVWAPNATGASVSGDFTAAPLVMTPGPGNVFEATSAAAHAGSTYAFTLDTPDGTLTRIDPYCRELDGSSCLVKRSRPPTRGRRRPSRARLATTPSCTSSTSGASPCRAAPPTAPSPRWRARCRSSPIWA